MNVKGKMLKSSRELIMRRRVNPLLVLTNIMKKVSVKTDEFLDEVWTIFNHYFTYKFLNKDKSRINYVVLRSERLAQIFNKVFNKMPTDAMLEAAVILYFVLKSEGILKRYKASLVNPVLGFISECVRDYNTGMAILESSPALSRCLGLSYVFTEELDIEHRKSLEELVKYCDMPEPRYTYFCLYATFSNILRIIINKERDDVICKHVANLYKSIIKSATLDDVVLMFLIIGLSRYNGCRNEKIALGLFQKLARTIELNSKNLLRKSRSTWQVLSLALRLNNLDKLTYVPEGYTVLKKEIAKKLAKILSEKSKRGKTLFEYFSLIIGSFSIILSIITVIFQRLQGISIIASLIAGSFLILITLFMIEEHRDVQRLLNEPEIQKLLEKIVKK